MVRIPDPVKLRARGQKLCAAREAKGLTQHEAAKAIRRDVAAISRVERGEIHFNVDDLKALCDLYGVTIDSVLAD